MFNCEGNFESLETNRQRTLDFIKYKGKITLESEGYIHSETLETQGQRTPEVKGTGDTIRERIVKWQYSSMARATIATSMVN